jgi:NAD+ kinase
MKNALMIVNRRKAHTDVICEKMESLLKERGVECVIFSPEEITPNALDKYPPMEVIFAIGGDGTYLFTARTLHSLNIPIVGINAGRLGFLMEINPENIETIIDKILGGKAKYIRRMMLDVEVRRGKSTIGRFEALNEAVISRGAAVSRMVDIDLRVSDEPLSKYRADGVIVCTSTGSTAYNLSAGGPVLLPGLEGFVITPICAHTLGVRPIVMSGDKEIELRNSTADIGVILSIDGQEHMEIMTGDMIIVRKFPHPVQMYYFGDSKFFETLREKLGWKV